MKLNRFKINQMVERDVNIGGRKTTGGSGVGGGGGVSASWVDENYISKAFFARLFTIHSDVVTQDDPHGEVVEPNDTETDIDNIELMFGAWTEAYLSVLGQGSGGGGGGSILTEPLASINEAGLGTPSGTSHQVIAYSSILGWHYAAIGGGSVTSVGLNMPAGFTVTNSPITSQGTLQVAFGGTITANTVLASPNGVDGVPSWRSLVAADIPDLSWNKITTDKPTTLSGYGITDAKIYNGLIILGNASVLPLTDAAIKGNYTWWGAALNASGVREGDMSNVGNITVKTADYGTKDITGFRSLEMYGSSGSSYIDFHYAGSSSDYTSRIIEGDSGVLKLNDMIWVSASGMAVNTNTIGSNIKLNVAGYTKTTRLYLDTNVYLEYDSENYGIHVVNAGFYSDTYISTLGAGSGGGSGSGITMADVWAALAATAPSASAEQINITHMTQALSYYATKDWANSLFVKQIKVGDTTYSPVNGLVDLGSSVVTDTKNTAGIQTWDSKKLYFVGSPSTSATTGTYSDTYTNSNCFIGTDNCLYSNSSKVLTEITNTMISSAFGGISAHNVYAGPVSGSDAAPLFRALVASDIPDLSSTYLPLSGGTLSLTALDGFKIKQTGQTMSLVTFEGLVSSQNASLGSLGFRDTNKPIFRNTSGTSYDLLHTGNLPDNLVLTTGDQDVGGSKHFTAETTIGTSGDTTNHLKVYGGLTCIRGGLSVGYKDPPASSVTDAAANQMTIAVTSAGVAALGMKLNGRTPLYSLMTLSHDGTSAHVAVNQNNVDANYNLHVSGNINASSGIYVGGSAVALASDIPSSADFVKTTGTQDIGGTKTFTDNLIVSGSSTFESSVSITKSNSTLYVGVNCGASSPYNLKVDGSTYLAGNVGINTTPYSGTNYRLKVSGDSQFAGKVWCNNIALGQDDGTGTYTISTYNADASINIVTDYVGIGGTNSSYKFYVNGTSYLNGNTTVNGVSNLNGFQIYYNSDTQYITGYRLDGGNTDIIVYTGGTSWCRNGWQNYSDMRLKDVDSNIDIDIKSIAEAPIFNFRWKEDDGRLHVGSSAQYWQGILENAVSEASNGILGLDCAATALAATVMTARKVMTHEEQIAALNRRIGELESEIKQLKAA